MLGAWAVLAGWLNFQQSATFHTHLFDLGYYTQVVWNTARGAWFANSLKDATFLSDHFAPLLAALAPLFWITPRPETLQLVKIAALALAGCGPYLWLRTTHPRLAPLLVFSYILNPQLHRLAFVEFHEIVLAAPCLSLALYAVHRRWLRLFWIAVGLTLLVREDMGFYIGLLGAFVILFHPHWRPWGGLCVVLGLGWSITTVAFLMPALRGVAGQEAMAGGSLAGERFQLMLSDPWRALGALFTLERWRALVGLLVPLAGLPLIARGEQILWGSSALLLLALPLSSVGALRDWYVAPLVPLLWFGAATAVQTWPARRMALALGGLAVMSLLSFLLVSEFPGGGAYQPANFVVTDHDLLGQALLAEMPPDQALVVQSGLGANVSARMNLRLFPWYENQPHSQWIVLDEYNRDIYPLDADGFRSALYQLQLDPMTKIRFAQDGYWVFEIGGPAAAVRPLLARWEPYLRLDGYVLAQVPANGRYRTIAGSLEPGGRLEVQLYWTALSEMPRNYTFSVVLRAPDGFVLAQHDGWPGLGSVGTTAWRPGVPIRDLHYLDLPVDSLPAGTTLNVVVYSADTNERLEPVDGVTIWAQP